MAKKESAGLFNNGIMALVLMSSLPMVIIIGIIWIVTQYGRVPGGFEVNCERAVSDTTQFRIERYAYTSGLTPYELQTFFVSTDSGGEWTEVFEVDIRSPEGISCQDNILEIERDAYIVMTQKVIAVSADAGTTWTVHHVCDDPRPTRGRCDAVPLNIAGVTFEDIMTGQITIQESAVDDYGQPLSDDGVARIKSEYTLLTQDGGHSWYLVE